MKTKKITSHLEGLQKLNPLGKEMDYLLSPSWEDLFYQEDSVELSKPVWRVTITYNSDGKFIYDSTEKDSWTAIAVATKQMFNKCVWLEPKTTRITGALIEDFRFVKETDYDD